MKQPLLKGVPWTLGIVVVNVLYIYDTNYIEHNTLYKIYIYIQKYNTYNI
jgi:hypothetical protein